MLTYRISEMPEKLENWPFEGEASDYQILRGAPQASGRLDIGQADSMHRAGIWRCTAGAFACNEMGDELQTIVSGRLRIVWPDGSEDRFGPGDSFFTRKGDRVVWDVLEDVTKVFFTHNKDGKPDETD